VKEVLRGMVLPSSANLVILASNYNPSIVSKDWLYGKGIFTEPVTNFVHTPVFSLVESDLLSLTVDEQRLQVVAKRVTEDNLNASADIGRKFVETLAETPYKAIGLNYHYNVPREGYDLAPILSPNDGKLREMLSSTYGLGAVLVFEFERFVVNFTIKPSFGKDQRVLMSFNFHSDTASASEVKEGLDAQARTLGKAETIMRELCKNG